MPTTYETREQDGKKYELFLFSVTLDTGTTYYPYTNYPLGMTKNADGTSRNYTAVEISSPELMTGRNGEDGDIQFSLPFDNPVAQLNAALFYPSVVSLTIYGAHVGDAGVDTIWVGTVAGVEIQGFNAVVRGESLLAKIRKRGLQYECGNTCNFTPYFAPCPLTWAANAQTLTVTSGQGTRALTVTGASGNLKGGIVKAANGDSRDIVDHTGSVLTLNGYFLTSTVANGGTVTAYPSCDLTYTGNARSCDTFAETDSGRLYGGFPHVPSDGNDPNQRGLA